MLLPHANRAEQRSLQLLLTPLTLLDGGCCFHADHRVVHMVFVTLMPPSSQALCKLSKAVSNLDDCVVDCGNCSLSTQQQKVLLMLRKTH